MCLLSHGVGAFAGGLLLGLAGRGSLQFTLLQDRQNQQSASLYCAHDDAKRGIEHGSPLVGRHLKR